MKKKITSILCEKVQSASKVKLLLFFLLLNSYAFSQYIYVSREGVAKVLRVNLGYTQWDLKADSVKRKAMGVHLLNEVKIVSAFLDADSKFTVHDAFYFDISIGKMTTPSRIYHWSFGDETEMKFSVAFNFGYMGLAGYREERWAALGGVDFRYTQSYVGKMSMGSRYMPMPVIRGEYGFSENNANLRAILTAWVNVSKKSNPYQMVRLELPLHGKGRWWLYAQYMQEKGSIADSFDTAPIIGKGTLSQWMIGVRIGNLP
jgi:hypothetical protein